MRVGVHTLVPDRCISDRRIALEDFRRSRELEEEEGASVLFRAPESESEGEKRAGKDASRADPSLRPLPSGPRK